MRPKKIPLALNGLPHASVRDVVVTADFTKRLPAAPGTTVGTNRGPAVCTLCNGTIAARRLYVAVTEYVFDLARGVHPQMGFQLTASVF